MVLLIKLRAGPSWAERPDWHASLACSICCLWPLCCVVALKMAMTGSMLRWDSGQHTHPHSPPAASRSVQVEAAAERSGRGNTDQHLTAEERKAFRMRADGALGDLQPEDHQQFVELNIKVRSGASFLVCCV